MFSKNLISLDIVIDDEFTGVMYGTPDESGGCQLKGKIVLRNRKPVSVIQLYFVFLGRTNVTCGPPMASRPEYNELQIIYREVFHFFEVNNTKKRISAGTHEYQFDIDLPGHLPSSFKGTRGKIEYSCYAILNRPIFHHDVTSKYPITLKRCLLNEFTPPSILRTSSEGLLDNRIQYQINCPRMAFCEGGLVSAELTLKPTNSDVIIESVEYGLREQTAFRTTGEASPIAVIASVNEESYPLGKIAIPIDPFNDSDTIPINFRLYPRVNCDVHSKLIELSHQLTFTITTTEAVQPITTREAERDNALGTLEGRSTRHLSFVPPSVQRRDPQAPDSPRRFSRTFTLIPTTITNTFRTLSLPYNSSAPSLTQQEQRQTKKLHLEVPVIITSKSDRRLVIDHQVPPSDEPPSYNFVAMTPSPPDYINTGFRIAGENSIMDL